MKSVAMGLAWVLLASGQLLWGREIFVDAAAKTSGDGSAQAPFRTVQEAANLAMPGDTVTIADGIYREWVRPPRGGTSDEKRITYRAAEGARPILTGGEPLTGWQDAGDGVWKLRVPDAFFVKWSGVNPFRDKIHGDFFHKQGREHPRAQLIVNGVRSPMSDDTVEALRKAPAKGEPLVNVASFTLADGTALPAGKVSASEGLKADGDGLTWIYDGAWARYDGVKAEGTITLRVLALPSNGCCIEMRDGSPTGRLLASVSWNRTSGWTSWAEMGFPLAEPTSSLCLVFRRPSLAGRVRWTVERDEEDSFSTVYARFPADPSTLSVEVTARPKVFYPPKTGRDYITLRGLTFRDGCPNWAPPTAEQEALVGTNWSRGWVIEDCEVYNSTCAGISLGKYGDCYDNYSGENSQIFVEGIGRAGAFGWDKVGHHVVRNCRIHDCGQVGVVGSLGCAFSRVEGCAIYDIHLGERFGGWEQSGIKFHAGVDVRLLNNRISRSGGFGIWLDWMTQGARISGNIIADTRSENFFVEVSHGPVLADNNIFVGSVRLNSQGVALVNNHIGGRISVHKGDPRNTPYFRPHSVSIAEMEAPNVGGDHRFVGNTWVMPVPADIKTKLPCFFRDNLAMPTNAFRVRMTADGGLSVHRTEAWEKALEGKTIPTPKAEDLPMALTPKMPFEDVDGKPFLLDKDLMGAPRGATTLPGPYAK